MHTYDVGAYYTDGVGPLHKIKWIMNQYMYKDILKEHLPKRMQDVHFAVEEIVFQHDQDSKHTAKSVTNWLTTQAFSILDQPAQSADPKSHRESIGYIEKKIQDAYKSPPSSLVELRYRTVESNAT